MQDIETETLWKHITGEAVYGELAGRQLELSNLLQMTVGQALAMDPGMQIAISDRPYGGKAQFGQNTGESKLMDMFEETLGVEDNRRPRMEMGLGIWTDKSRRFYPVNILRDKGRAVFDKIDGRQVLVYLDPVTSTPSAMYVDAGNVKVKDKDIVLDDGQVVRKGVLIGKDDQKISVQRPNQIFTRWYGFSLTFPGPDIYK